MKTKLFSLILIFSLSGSMAFAQGPAGSKTSFAILGGVNLQNLNGKDMSGDKLENDMLIGFHAGVNLQLPFAPEFYFQPGLMFSTKGAKNTEGDFSGTYNLSYIELPLNLVYKALVGNGYFFLGFGPYVAYGIGGKVTYEGGAASVETDIEFKNEVESGDPLTTVLYKNLTIGYKVANFLMGEYYTILNKNYIIHTFQVFEGTEFFSETGGIIIRTWLSESFII